MTDIMYFIFNNIFFVVIIAIGYYIYHEYKDLKNDQLCDIIQEKIPNEKWNIDTVLINKIILQKTGLKQDNIVDSGICSVCHSDLIHSFRVEKQGYGLNAAFIMIEK